MQFPFDDSGVKTIAVRFPCPYCDIEVHSGYIFLHGADYAAKTNDESLVCEDYDATCDDCDNQFWFSVCIGKENSYIETEEDDNIENLRIDVIDDSEFHQYHIEEFEAISGNKNLLKTFKSSINNLTKLNKVDLRKKELNAILKLQIYSGLIAAMETFLCDTMVNLTFATDKYIRRFVETSPEIRKRRFDLNNIFTEYEKIKTTVKTILIDTNYHDLRKIKSMYEDTFEIEFPNIDSVIKCVLMRHDIVHRNGKTKDDKQIILNSKQVNSAIQLIDSFISEIAALLRLN